MSAQANDPGGELAPDATATPGTAASAPPANAPGHPVGQWRPVRPHGGRTPKQAKRELRKDRQRRRRIAERAQHDPTLTDFEVRTLQGYLAHSDDTGAPVWPAVATVADKVHGHPRSIRRCVAQLEVAGYIQRFMRPVPGARNRSNMYYFCEPAGPVPAHRPEQRRRPRNRRSDTRTARPGGTPKGVEEPSQAGAETLAPPPTTSKNATGRSNIAVAAQPGPFPAPHTPPVPPNPHRHPASDLLRDARAKLARIPRQPRRP